MVDLHVSVIDKNGKLITDMPESAFKVYENGVEQPLKRFLREDVPVSMGIIIDNSGSMRDKRAKVAAASVALVKASNPQDEEFIVDFNDDAYLDQPLTGDIKKLEAALDAKIDIEAGVAEDTITLRNTARVEAQQRAAEDLAAAHPMTRTLLSQFPSARILPGSVQPVLTPST